MPPASRKLTPLAEKGRHHRPDVLGRVCRVVLKKVADLAHYCVLGVAGDRLGVLVEGDSREHLIVEVSVLAIGLLADEADDNLLRRLADRAQHQALGELGARVAPSSPERLGGLDLGGQILRVKAVPLGYGDKLAVIDAGAAELPPKQVAEFEGPRGEAQTVLRRPNAGVVHRTILSDGRASRPGWGDVENEVGSDGTGLPCSYTHRATPDFSDAGAPGDSHNTEGVDSFVDLAFSSAPIINGIYRQ